MIAVVGASNYLLLELTPTVTITPEGGTLTENNTIYFYDTLFLEVDGDVPAEVVPIKYCFNTDKGFYKNVNYSEPIPLEDVRALELQAEIERLRAILTANGIAY